MTTTQQRADMASLVQSRECWYGFEYVGTSDELIAAGIITWCQLPGTPGMPKSSVTFINGVQQPPRTRAAHDERWMRVALYGKKISVSKGISGQEREQREARKAAALAADRQARGIPAIGLAAAAREVAQASAEFQVGDAVLIGGVPAVVTGHFSLQAVSTKNGEYVDVDGDRLVYRPGYVCRYEGGDEYFWPAHKVKRPDGSRSHLQLVRERVAPATQTPSAVPIQGNWPFPIVGNTFMGVPTGRQGVTV